MPSTESGGSGRFPTTSAAPKNSRTLEDRDGVRESRKPAPPPSRLVPISSRARRVVTSAGGGPVSFAARRGRRPRRRALAGPAVEERVEAGRNE